MKMKKFTIFTIIFSIVVIITVGELVVNDYLDRHNDDNPKTAEEVPNEEVAVAKDEVVTNETSTSSYLSGLDYASYGFAADYELKEKNFPDSIFYLLEFDNDSVETLYYELFEGKTFVGGLYEIICSDPTEAFTVYADLKQSGLDQADSGELNEVNNYGDASFYFNNSVKTTSIFLVVLKGDRVYAFTYDHSYHDAFKALFEAF